jgi:serine/threonine-protein kinase
VLFAAAGIAVLAAVAAGFLLRRALDDRAAAAAAAIATQQRRPMIAVLPFDNLGAPGDLYFSDGVTDEIRSRLGSIEGLGVISRLSATRYRDSQLGAREIGAELGVDYLLEGTVRWHRSTQGGGEVRVSPRLVRVERDEQVWSQQYRASLEDVFEVQADIARRVVDRLGLAIRESEAQAFDARPTANAEAYDAFLRGEDYANRASGLQSANEMTIAIGMYEQAVRLDPRFALAWSRLSYGHSWLYHWYFDRTEARLDAARDAVARALELDPHIPEGRFALGRIVLAEDQPERAMTEFRAALRLQPNHAEALGGMSFAAIALGDWEQGRHYALRALELDSGSAALACWAGGTHSYIADYAGAIEHHEHAVELAPDRACHYFCEVEAYLNWDGGTRRARSFLEQLPDHLDLERSPSIEYQWVQVEMIEGRFDEALSRLAGGRSPVLESPWFLVPKSLLAAQVHALRGESELAGEAYRQAAQWLEPLVEQRPLDARLRSAIGMAYAGLGRREEAVREAERGVDLLGANKTDVFYRLRDLAVTHAVLGDHGPALAALERLLALRGGYFSPAFLRIDPGLRELRGDPRFAALLSEAGRLVPGAPQPQSTRSASAGLAEDPSLGRMRTEQAKRPDSSSGIDAR